MKSITTNLNDLTEDDEVKTNWLEGSAEEWDKLVNLLQEDLVKPTNSLSDLMYKSVGIRDVSEAYLRARCSFTRSRRAEDADLPV